tara:strand:+ start:912 stop:1400 length:489 start_codon:yes stop_codon:yes gene_type:complete
MDPFFEFMASFGIENPIHAILTCVVLVILAFAVSVYLFMQFQWPWFVSTVIVLFIFLSIQTLFSYTTYCKTQNIPVNHVLTATIEWLIPMRFSGCHVCAVYNASCIHYNWTMSCPLISAYICPSLIVILVLGVYHIHILPKLKEDWEEARAKPAGVSVHASQ